MEFDFDDRRDKWDVLQGWLGEREEEEDLGGEEVQVVEQPAPLPSPVPVAESARATPLPVAPLLSRSASPYSLVSQPVAVPARAPVARALTPPLVITPIPRPPVPRAQPAPRRPAPSLPAPAKRRKRTHVSGNDNVPNVNIVVWDCPTLQPRLSLHASDPSPTTDRILPLQSKHLTFDNLGQPPSAPSSRSTYRFHLGDDWFEDACLVGLTFEGAPSAIEQKARGEAYVAESWFRLGRGMSEVWCVVKRGSVEWSCKAE